MSSLIQPDVPRIELARVLSDYDTVADTSALIGTLQANGLSSPKALASQEALLVEQGLHRALSGCLDKGYRIYMPHTALKNELLIYTTDFPADVLAAKRGLPAQDVEKVYAARRQFGEQLRASGGVIDDTNIQHYGGANYPAIIRAVTSAFRDKALSDKDADVLAVATALANSRGRAAMLTNDSGIFNHWRILVHKRPAMRSRLACFKRATEDSCEPWYIKEGGLSY